MLSKATACRCSVASRRAGFVRSQEDTSGSLWGLPANLDSLAIRDHLAGAVGAASSPGSTIPIKFRISDHAGSPVADAVCTRAVYYLESGAPAGEPHVVSTAAGDRGNRLGDSDDGDLYIFNLSTKDASFIDCFTYRAEVTLDDGSAHSADLSLKWRSSTGYLA